MKGRELITKNNQHSGRTKVKKGEGKCIYLFFELNYYGAEMLENLAILYL